MLSSLLLVAALSPDAEARSRHRTRGIHADNGTRMDATPSARSRRAGNDKRLKAASDDADKLLNTRIKSICRGC